MTIARTPDGAPQFADQGDQHSIEHGHVFQPRFDDHGLIAAIVCDAASGDVLMFAWMNAEALALTLSTRRAHFYSRSRQKLWMKGEDSGNVLAVIEVRTDCDQDVVLVRATVGGRGAACHTGARSCFYRAVALGEASPATRLSPVGLQPVVK